MKKIDQYIIRKFLGTFFYAILLFLSIAVVIDISEKIDDFIDESAPLSAIITDYYFGFLPHIGLLLSPLFIFIAVIFFTSKMAYNSEIIAILSSGISFKRLMLPYFIAATFLTALLLFANHYIVPEANKSRIDFENTYILRPYYNTERNIHMQIAPNTFIYVENFNSRDSSGYKFALEKFEGQQLIYKLRADKISWNNEKKQWNIKNYFIREFKNGKEIIRKGSSIDTTLKLTPGDFGRRLNIKEAMTTPELNELIEKERLKGTDIAVFYEIEKQRRTSTPFATFILTLIGVSIASRKVRGGRGLHIALGIGISAAYIVMLQFSTTFSTNAGLPPLLGVWIPNLVFGALSLYLLRVAPK